MGDLLAGLPSLAPDAGKIRFAEDIVGDFRGGEDDDDAVAAPVAVATFPVPVGRVLAVGNQVSAIPKARHIPERSCVACGRKLAKGELIPARPHARRPNPGGRIRSAKWPRRLRLPPGNLLGKSPDQTGP